ncbi:hypothetical protein P2R10_14875, partial [Escherichia coli]
LMMSLWDALRMNMMISYQELVRTFLSDNRHECYRINDKNNELLQREHKRIRAKIALITGC